MSGRRPKFDKALIRLDTLSDDYSGLANRVYDLLLGGEWEAALQLSDGVLQELPALLGQLLLSDEPLAPELRVALASTLLGFDNPAVRLQLKVIRKPTAFRMVDEFKKELDAAKAYEAARASGRSSYDAMQMASKAIGRNGDRDTPSYVSRGRAVLKRLEDNLAAKEGGASDDEMDALYALPLPKAAAGRPKGSKSRT